MAEAAAQAWATPMFDALRDHGVRQVAYVPDAGHKTLIEACGAGPAMETVALTTEEEGIALLSGAWLGGQRGVLLMQSSGLGNCINMFSLARVCRFPLLMLVTMRGQWGEFNPWQVPMGQMVEPVLRLGEALVFPLERAQDARETVWAAGRMAFEGPAIAAVLIGQRLIGAKSFNHGVRH